MSPQVTRYIDCFQKFQSKADGILGRNCEKLLDDGVRLTVSHPPFANALRSAKVFFTLQAANAKIFEFENKVKASKDQEPSKLPRDLASYSPWLSQYDAQRLGIYLEIPGEQERELNTRRIDRNSTFRPIPIGRKADAGSPRAHCWFR